MRADPLENLNTHWMFRRPCVIAHFAPVTYKTEADTLGSDGQDAEILNDSKEIVKDHGRPNRPTTPEPWCGMRSDWYKKRRPAGVPAGRHGGQSDVQTSIASATDTDHFSIGMSPELELPHCTPNAEA